MISDLSLIGGRTEVLGKLVTYQYGNTYHNTPISKKYYNAKLLPASMLQKSEHELDQGVRTRISPSIYISSRKESM